MYFVTSKAFNCVTRPRLRLIPLNRHSCCPIGTGQGHRNPNVPSPQALLSINEKEATGWPL